MTLDILICTIDHGIDSVPGVLLKPVKGVRYVVSMQYTDEKYLNSIPQGLKSREDVRIITMEGSGLTRNRNNALAASDADIVMIADDDERLSSTAVEIIRHTYNEHPDVDIALFRLNNIDDQPFKDYPDAEQLEYREACRQGYYPSSLEITMRGKVIREGLRFNKQFGLGSLFPCGEEDILIYDALLKNHNVMLFNKVIAQTIAGSTGSKFLTDNNVQRAKGAVFRYCFGKWNAIWRITKEACFYLIHKGRNPFPLFHNMMKGFKQVKHLLP